MATQVVLSVYRRLDNRFEGLSDDSPRALELHNQRKAALHEVLDGEEAVEVLDWGCTNDSRPHELVELTIGAAASAVFSSVVVPAAKWVGQKVAEKVADEGASAFAKWIVGKLVPKQESKEINDFWVKVPAGAKIHCNPPGRDPQIEIYLPGQKEPITVTHARLGEAT